MNCQRFVLHTAAVSIAFLMFSASAWADLTGTVYRIAGNGATVDGAFEDATLGTPANLGTAATISATSLANLNFEVPSVPANAGGSLGDFLNSGVPFGATITNVNNGWLAELASGNSTDNGTDGANCYGTNNQAAPCYSTEIEFTGNVTLTQNTKYTFEHDDGLVVQVNGGPIGFNNPGPTGETPDSFTWTAQTQTVSIAIAYVATNGNPEVLQESESAVTPVPEPGAVSMLIAMLVGVAGFAGILKKKLA